MNAERLRCEHLENPLSVEVASPRLSWWCRSDAPGDRQTAYRLQVASTADLLQRDRPDLWDSDRVSSDDHVLIRYRGAALGSRTSCHWRVRLWDADEREGPWSATARWEMGLLDAADWTAEWIHDPLRSEGHPGRVSAFRRRFAVDEPPQKARLYSSALGLYQMTLNGVPVSDAVLRPGWTDHFVRTQYQVSDVTHLLRPGDNELHAVLAEGWYAGQIAWQGREVYGSVPSLRAQLELGGESGDRRTSVSTDESWEVAWSSLLESGLLAGETWDLSADAMPWRDVAVTDGVTTRLVAETCPPVRRTAELPGRSSRRIAAGRTIVDLGQNMVGWVRLHVATPPPGGTVTVRHAEALDAEGSLYTENLRGAAATERYTMGDTPGAVDLEPRFTFHGFRYVEVSGAELGDASDVTGVVVHTDLPVTGGFECSHPLLNQLHQNILWSQRGNFLEVPTDCPQRDERLGWSGDAQVFAPTACFSLDCSTFYAKWLRDFVDGQSADGAYCDVAPRLSRNPFGGEWPQAAPGWGDAGVIVPWTLYRHYGDLDVVDRNFDAMLRWIRFIQQGNPDDRWRHRRGNDYGDWLSLGEETPKELVATAYWAHSTRLLARMAALTGRTDVAGEMEELAGRIRAAFRADHVGADLRLTGDTQTAYVLALRFGLLDEGERAAAVDHLVRRITATGGHLATGFLGVYHLLDALSENGRLDVAYQLLTTETHPSWLYPVRHGATTIWERWDGWTEERGFQNPGMNSFNHYALGSVGAWMYANIGGIALHPDVPAYRTALLAPRPGGGITWARAHHDSIRGRYECRWQLERGEMTVEVVVPPSCDAVVRLPSLAESGEGIEDVHVGSGRHRFVRPAAAVATGGGVR